MSARYPLEPLHGRVEILARAANILERVCEGEGAMMLLSGEPGIGKSRIAERVAEMAEAAGAAVVWGRCWEAGGAPAYWPWIQVFRGLQLDEDPFLMSGRDRAFGAGEVRFQAFDEAVRRIKARAAQAPIVMVLDDLHAADASSLLLLLLLARELRRSRIFLLGAYRDAEARSTADVSSLLGKIARQGELMTLSRLALDDVREWLLDVSPGASAAQVADLHRLTEGHPLFVHEVLRLRGRGLGIRAGVIDGLRSVLDERLSCLSASTRAVIEVAAVLGREFSSDEIAEIGSVGRDETHRELRDARAASIVVDAASPGRFLFSHVLLRDRVYADILPSKRAALHWKAGLAKLAHGEALQAAAHHLFEGQSAGEPTRVAEVALAAAEAALARLAFEDGAQLAQRGLALTLRGASSARIQCQLRLILAEALVRLGQLAGGQEAAIQSAELATQIEAHDLLARAALVYGTEITSGVVDPKMVSLLREALAHLGNEDSAIRARVMARLSTALVPPNKAEDVTEIAALVRASTAMARRLGDPRTSLYVLQFVTAAGGWLVSDDERMSNLEEIATLALSLNEKMVLVASYGAYITALLAHCRRVEAKAALAAYEKLLAELSQPQQHWHLPLARAIERAVAGDFEEAERLNLEARTLADEVGSRSGAVRCLTQQLAIAHFSGRYEGIARDAARLIATLRLNLGTKAYVAWVLAVTGHRDEARQFLSSVEFIPGNFLGLLAAAEACAVLDDSAQAEFLYPLLLAYQDRPMCILGEGSLLGPTHRVLGDLAVLLGRAGEAIGHYDNAAAYCERLGATRLAEVCRRSRNAAALGAGLPAAAVPAESAISVVREGDFWVVQRSPGPAVRLRHGKGLVYLSYLVEQPGREVHVLDLIGVEYRASDAGPLLDARAKEAYRLRLDDLREEMQEAERFGDPGRVSRAQDELAAIAEQLAGAVGLGGRDRRAASDVERARINVQRRLKDVTDRISAMDAALGRYLAASVKTGSYCVFRPF